MESRRILKLCGVMLMLEVSCCATGIAAQLCPSSPEVDPAAVRMIIEGEFLLTQSAQAMFLYRSGQLVARDATDFTVLWTRPVGADVVAAATETSELFVGEGRMLMRLNAQTGAELDSREMPFELARLWVRNATVVAGDRGYRHVWFDSPTMRSLRSVQGSSLRWIDLSGSLAMLVRRIDPVLERQEWFVVKASDGSRLASGTVDSLGASINVWGDRVLVGTGAEPTRMIDATTGQQLGEIPLRIHELTPLADGSATFTTPDALGAVTPDGTVLWTQARPRRGRLIVAGQLFLCTRDGVQAIDSMTGQRRTPVTLGAGLGSFPIVVGETTTSLILTYGSPRCATTVIVPKATLLAQPLQAR